MNEFDEELLKIPPFDSLTLAEHKYIESMWLNGIAIDFVAAKVGRTPTFVRAYYAIRDLIVFSKTGDFPKGPWG